MSDFPESIYFYGFDNSLNRALYTNPITGNSVVYDGIAGAIAAGQISSGGNIGGILSSPSAEVKVFVHANTQDLTGASNVTFASTGTVPKVLHSYADAVVAAATYSVAVPAGKTSIRSIKVHYLANNGFAADAVLRLTFTTSRERPDASPVNDTNDIESSYTAVAETVGTTFYRSINLPTRAYDGLTVQGGDVVNLQVSRDGADAADTYNSAWQVIGVEFNFGN